VNKKRTILVVSLAILAALLFAGAAQPQALIVGTDGQAGDAKGTLGAVRASLENDDATASVSAGEGQGSAATADVRNGTDSGNAVVGCVDASAASGDDGGSANVGNCGGDGTAGSASLGSSTAGAAGGAGFDLGCIVAEVFGVGSGGAQVGSCEEETGGGGDEEGGAAGDIGGNADEDQGSGAAGAEAGVSAGAGVEGDSGSGGGQGDAEPCATFAQTSALTGSGALPFWALGVAAIAAFGLGTVFARRRTKEVDPTG
jgi:hypothetical protein